MSSFPILDLVVGMIFLYFLLSIISSSAVEMLMVGYNARGKILKEWLLKIFDTPFTQPNGSVITLGQAIMDHCAVTALTKKNVSPSYIDAKNFTAALLERITYNPANPQSVAANIADIITAVEKTNILSIEIKRALLSFAYDARDTYAAVSNKGISQVQYFTLKIENWYDTSMDRLTGTLKRRYSRKFTIIIALCTVVLLNADSIVIARYLYSNPEVRIRLVEQAYNAAKDTVLLKTINDLQAAQNDTVALTEVKAVLQNGIENVNQAKAALQSSIPIGWNENELLNGNGEVSFVLLITKISGLLLTVLAIIMGAPFWFDVLNKIANMRGTGPRPVSTHPHGDGKPVQ